MAIGICLPGFQLQILLLSIFVIAPATLKSQEKEQPPSLDFAQCEPGSGSFYGALGSTTYQIVGKSRHGCVMLYGREVENPFWNGLLESICIVPEDEGTVVFRKQVFSGPDFSILDRWCVEVPEAISRKVAEEYVHPGEVIDFDGDGYANLDDNCPEEPNPEQADADGDAVGDVCDLCRDRPAPGYTNGCTEDMALPDPIPSFRSSLGGTVNGTRFSMTVWQDGGRERREIEIGDQREIVILRPDRDAIYMVPGDGREGIVLAFDHGAAGGGGALPEDVRQRLTRLGPLARPVEAAAWLADVYRVRLEDDTVRFRVDSTRYHPVESGLFEIPPGTDLRDLR